MYSNCVYTREMCPGEDVRTSRQATKREQTWYAWMGLPRPQVWEHNAVGGAGEMDIETPHRVLCTYFLEDRGE